MSILDTLGTATASLLLAGFAWALIDLLKKIHRQPRRKFDFLRLTSYPFVPDDEILKEMLHKDEGRSSSGGLRLEPVPVKVKSKEP